MLLVIDLSFDRIWKYLWQQEVKSVQEEMNKVVREYCTRSLLLTAEPAGVQDVCRAPRDELKRALELTNDSLYQLQIFKPIHRGQRVPGLEDVRLCNSKLQDIAIAVQQQVMSELSLRRATILTVVGDENELSESLDILSRLIDPGEIARLRKRRAEICEV